MTVVFGVLSATIFGLWLTPLFFVWIDNLKGKILKSRNQKINGIDWQHEFISICLWKLSKFPQASGRLPDRARLAGLALTTPATDSCVHSAQK